MKSLIPHIEPRVRVGLSEGGEFGLSPHGNYDILSSDNGIIYSPVDNNSFFEVTGIEIGRGFHWEREKTMKFPGIIQIIAKKGKKSTLVNIVGAEKYLKSVIGSEMSPTANLEFQKAHAIISRSWLMRMLCYKNEKHNIVAPVKVTTPLIYEWTQADSHTDFDICSDDHCQRYQGLECESELSRAAVDATRGIVLVNDAGDIVDARFSKCCGGKTELFSTCWDDVDYPYLISLDDRFCNPDVIASCGDKNLLKPYMKDYDLESADYYRWRTEVSKQLIRENLLKYYGVDVGNVVDIRPLQRGPSGRIKLIQIIGELSEVTIGKELTIRRVFSTSHLKSSAFNILKTDAGFILEGSGWGHGVGLCQIGAAVMSLKGYSYEEILQHYYPNTHLIKIYD